MRFPKRAAPLKCEAARQLRRVSTPAERTVWQLVRNRRLLGLKFRRQHVIDGFIVDFYCPALRLILEVDGSVHDSFARMDCDQARADHFTAHWFQILRIRNEDVSREAIIAAIARVFSPVELNAARQNRNPSP